MTNTTIHLGDFSVINGAVYASTTITAAAGTRVLITNSRFTNCDLTGLGENTSIIGCILDGCTMPKWFDELKTVATIVRYADGV